MRRRRPHQPPSAQPERAARLHIEVCADPETTMHLMGLRGILDNTTVSAVALAFSEVPDGSALHLDVADARIFGIGVVRHLERLVDHLEQRCVRLRVVGFDPHHPALNDDRLRS